MTKTILIVCAIVLVQAGTGFSYIEDFDDGVADGWIQNSNVSVVSVVNDDGSYPFVPGSDGELLRGAASGDPVDMETAAVLDDGSGTHNYGDGIYQIDMRFLGDNYESRRGCFNILGSNAGASTGDTQGSTTGAHMTNSLGLMVGATTGDHLMLIEYKDMAHESTLATYGAFFHWGSLPVDHTYRLRLEVTDNASSVSVYASYGEESEDWFEVPGMQDISLVGTSVEDTTGYMSVSVHDTDGIEGRKQFDNVSYTNLDCSRAYLPDPVDESATGINLGELSWRNPAPQFPGDPISVDVIFGIDGTDPNNWSKIVDREVTESTTNVPALEGNTTYAWQVDCYDPNGGDPNDPNDPSVIWIEGYVWTFTIENQPPEVDAGEDQAVRLPDGTTDLDGTVTDDGLPEGVPLAHIWTQESGPSSVAFGDETAVDTTATFGATGVYILRLTATDTEFGAYDEVQITVPTCDDVRAAGHVIAGDISGPLGVPDCYVDLYDFATMAADWLYCTDPEDADCVWTGL